MYSYSVLGAITPFGSLVMLVEFLQTAIYQSYRYYHCQSLEKTPLYERSNRNRNIRKGGHFTLRSERTFCSCYYNTNSPSEQAFLLFIYKILLNIYSIYEHLCSNLQFISLPEEVGEFLLYIMLKFQMHGLVSIP